MTIDFFELDTREVLLQQRARKIVMLGLALLLEENPLHADFARRQIELETAPNSPHTSCGRAFIALFRTDPQRARELSVNAQEYLGSIGGV